ncbi:hypothetical protein LTS15_004604 [Exophiala xenobiotica]|nr:hypothetical protein LTS15_004604 [Exophiala xenobiotica]
MDHRVQQSRRTSAESSHSGGLVRSAQQAEYPLKDYPSAVREAALPYTRLTQPGLPQKIRRRAENISGERASLLREVRRSRTHNNTADRERQEWLPLCLSWRLNIPLFLIELAFIVAVITLEGVSASNDGIADIPGHVLSGRLGKFASEYYGLLWTSLPSFLFNLYGLVWAMVVTASATRQPYVELQRPDGACALKTIMLDYTSIPAWKSWWVAMHNKHIHLAVGMLLALLVSNVLSALASHLLVAQTARFRIRIPVTFTSAAFDPSLLTAKTNLQPFIDIATAVQVYKTSPAAWTTDTYAFRRFTLLNTPHPIGNVTADTSAYSALLECDTIDAADYDFKLDELADDTQTLTLNFIDRGCAVSQYLSLSPNTPVYAATWYTMCSNSDINRFGMFAGHYSTSSATRLNNFSVTSCIPTYWQTNGSLMMSYSGNRSSAVPTFLGFNGQSQEQIYPGLEVIFESVLRDYTIFNPAGATNADAVGYAIYSAAQQRFSQSSPDSAAIRQTTPAVYATVFAAMTSTVLLPESTVSTTSSSGGSGALAVFKDRLFVDSTIAYIFVGAMAIVLVCHVVLFIYAKRSHTPLDEEPIGLLGAAKLLRRSDIFEIIDNFEERHTEDRQLAHMQKYMRKHFRLGQGDRCQWVEGERRVKVLGMTED